MLPTHKLTTAIISAENDSGSIHGDQKPQKIARHLKLNYWSPEEQTIYLNFLRQHMPMITSSQYRKKQRIFKKISALLGTRTPIQVKSHHQKLEDKFKNVSKIIAYLEKALKINGGEGECEETLSTVSQFQTKPKDPHIKTELQTIEVPFFEVEYPENNISLRFIEEDDILFFDF